MRQPALVAGLVVARGFVVVPWHHQRAMGSRHGPGRSPVSPFNVPQRRSGADPWRSPELTHLYSWKPTDVPCLPHVQIYETSTKRLDDRSLIQLPCKVRQQKED